MNIGVQLQDLVLLLQRLLLQARARCRCFSITPGCVKPNPEIFAVVPSQRLRGSAGIDTAAASTRRAASQRSSGLSHRPCLLLLVSLRPTRSAPTRSSASPAGVTRLVTRRFAQRPRSPRSPAAHAALKNHELPVSAHELQALARALHAAAEAAAGAGLLPGEWLGEAQRKHCDQRVALAPSASGSNLASVRKPGRASGPLCCVVWGSGR